MHQQRALEQLPGAGAVDDAQQLVDQERNDDDIQQVNELEGLKIGNDRIQCHGRTLLLPCFDQGDGVGGNAQSLAGKAQMLFRGSLDAHGVHRQAESRRQIGPHGRDVRGQLGPLAEDGGVDVFHR